MMIAETDTPNLTARETECLGALAEGLSSEGIARRLKISIPTVAMHVTNARHKLNAQTREQAVAIAVRKGLVK
jgi:DNA-binding CsgD family transcriptional regulator